MTPESRTAPGDSPGRLEAAFLSAATDQSSLTIVFCERCSAPPVVERAIIWTM